MIIMGDSHSLGSFKQALKQANVQNQQIVHVGDFGLGFKPLTEDLKDLERLDNILADNGNTLSVIRGNHDNPIFWNRKFGLNLPKYYSFDLVDDYTIKRIEDKNILFMGGAISIDRLIRGAEHPPTWWVNERFDFSLVKLKTVLDRVDKIDAVVTHIAPSFVYPYLRTGFPALVQQFIDLENQHLGSDLEQDLINERIQLHDIYTHMRLDIKKIPDKWFYGHFHKQYKENHNGTEFICLGINEMYKY